MKTALILIGIGWVIWVIWMYKEIKNAPEGYEKDDKFYYGKEPINKENKKNE